MGGGEKVGGEEVGEGRRWRREGGGGWGRRWGRGGGGEGKEVEGEEVEKGRRCGRGGGRGKEEEGGIERKKGGGGGGETVSCSTHPRVLTTSKQCHMITKEDAA